MENVKVSAKQAQDFCVECFLKLGVPKEDAENIADNLVLANLRGVDSHGIIRIPYYTEGIRKGFVQARSDIHVVKESSSITLMDGGNGLGIPVATKATDLAIDKANTTGVGVVGVRNLGHVGMLAYYMKKAIRHGFIGFACVNAPAVMIPWGGKENMFGTNPMCVGFPMDEGSSIILDMATSGIARFKITVAALRGKEIPEGVALDKQGRPTTDPKEALEGFLLPFGGYKGYGLVMAVEVLSSVLLGALQSKDIEVHPSTQGGFFITIIDISRFRDYEEYKKDVLHLIGNVKSCPVTDGFTEILIPGEIEEREFEKIMRDGIPIEDATWKELIKIAKELNIKPLDERRSL
jgi:LDH2 family malate/lactate/ureidoglycolate dehydrogenase